MQNTITAQIKVFDSVPVFFLAKAISTKPMKMIAKIIFSISKFGSTVNACIDKIAPVTMMTM